MCWCDGVVLLLVVCIGLVLFSLWCFVVVVLGCSFVGCAWCVCCCCVVFRFELALFVLIVEFMVFRIMLCCCGLDCW